MAGVASPVYRRQLLSLRDGLAEQQQQQQLQQLQQQEARQGISTPAGSSSAPTSTAKALNTLSAKLGKALGAGAKPGGETWIKAAGGKLLVSKGCRSVGSQERGLVKAGVARQGGLRTCHGKRSAAEQKGVGTRGGMTGWQGSELEYGSALRTGALAALTPTCQKAQGSLELADAWLVRDGTVVV